MLPFWFILGLVIILMGIFSKQLLGFLGFKPMSESLTTPNLKRSSRVIEQLAQWLVVILGLSFLVIGIAGLLPRNMGDRILFSLMGLSGAILLGIIGITLANWKAR